MTGTAQTYRVTEPFWHGARLLAVGDPVDLTDAQAKYRAGQIELADKPAPSRKRPAQRAPEADAAP